MKTRLLMTICLAWGPGCAETGCLSGAAGCEVPEPCGDLTFSCEGGEATIRAWTVDDEAPSSMASLVSPGDIVMSNGRVTAVIEALDHPHYLGPTGGGLLDLWITGQDNDVLRQVTQGVGLLPDDAAHYTELELIETSGPSVALQVRGHLDGYPDIRIATRYELGPCDPGLRVRTELVNDSPHTRTLALLDAWYFGDRQLLPFAPTPGGGFEHPSFGLSDVADAFRSTPYMAAAGRVAPAASYGSVSCDIPALEGFHSVSVSAVGPPRRIVKPGDFLTWERFLSVGDGASASAAIDTLLEVRRQLWEEAYVTLSGQIAVEGDGLGSAALDQLQVIISAGQAADDPASRTPVTHVVPRADGTFEVAVPAGQSYVADVQAFGRTVSEVDVAVADGPADLGLVTVPEVAALRLVGTIDGEPDWLLAFVTPSEEAEVDPLVGQFLGQFESCAPLLGHPHGDSPACDRVLFEGEEVVLVPPGTYDIRSVAGPFSTLAEQRGVTLTAGQEATVSLDIEMLPLQPEGTMSADFHVHGGGSFDIGFSAEERVRSFLASRIDLVASTEHDTVYNYADVLADVGGAGRMIVLDGTEATGHILFDVFDDASFPKVFGHWNLWPIPFDVHSPWRGAPWDELALPGTFFDRAVDVGFDRDVGVIQLNHPWGGFSFGRDFGWVETLGLDLSAPLPDDTYDGSGQSMFRHKPTGASYANSDYHVQEVMNGSANAGFMPYRAIWHYLLGQGVLRGGTANSDSHSLTENVLGMPRNIVWSDTSVADFDLATFQTAVREGRMVGTNGPMIEVTVTDTAGVARRPSLQPLQPAADAQLTVRVSAAPWVPIDEVRLVANGQVVKVWTSEALEQPADDFDAAVLQRLDAEVSLAELGVTADAWLVVEAGAVLPDVADLDCDGIPDTTDNNGDGLVSWRDVDGTMTDPRTDCLSSVGPLEEPEAPSRGARGYAFSVVSPGGHPMAFSNPLVLDVDGDGFEVTP